MGRQTIDNWALAIAVATYAASVAIVLGMNAKTPWCGMQECDLPSVIYGYQTLIVGIGAIVVAHFTIRATRKAAHDQVTGALQAAERQIVENKALLETELAAQRETADRERRLKARAVALAVYPAVMEMQSRAQSMSGFIQKVRNSGGTEVSRTDETVHALTIPVPPALIRWSGDLYILGDRPGGDLIQLASMCELNNRMISETKRNSLMPELHSEHAKSVIHLCDEIVDALRPFHDGASLSA
jgi:hypothetical protein